MGKGLCIGIGLSLVIHYTFLPKPMAQLWDDVRDKVSLPCVITMPCGQVVICIAKADIPKQDVPCPCGDPNHWLVKYWFKYAGHDN